MYILIDLENMKMISRGSYRALCNFAGASLGDDSSWAVGPIEKPTFKDFTETELRLIYQNSSKLDSASITKWKLAEACIEFAQTIYPVSPIFEEKCFEPIQHKEHKEPNQSPSEPVKSVRPAAGTTTGKVWEFADNLLAKGTHLLISKTFKEELIRICVENGINASTAQVQYSKWKKHH